MLKHKLRLKILLSDLCDLPNEYDREIQGLALDSQKVQPDFVFLAYPGLKEDGRNFINSAITNGAVAILCEGTEIKFDKRSTPNNKLGIPIIFMPKLAELAGPLAAKFYNHPSEKMKIIGVTGTAGKTSITHFIANSLETLGQKCGIIGTLGVGFPGGLSPTGLTTPDPILLQNKFADFLEKGANAVAMEVSSIRLEQNRLQGVNFNIAIFTNLTRDHLDYHKNLENYGAAKQKLFMYPGLDFAIINIDDPFGLKLLHNLPSSVKPFAYSITSAKANVPTLYAQDIRLTASGQCAKIATPWGKGLLQTSLLGKFNLSNLLAVLATLCILEIDLQKALDILAMQQTVSGRMQVLGGGKLPLVVIDYAHKPDALEKALLALREHCRGELWCVFGCGGDRDKGKRPLMGKIAEHLSDQVIITSDNPRSEDPEKIIDDILQGLLCPWAAEVEENREVAIYHAIDCAKPQDVILIAGKGHENYQLIGNTKIPFSDLTKASEALMQKK